MKPEKRVAFVIVILLLGLIASSCSWLRRKPALTWHVLLEIGPVATDREAVVKQTIAVIEKRLTAAGIPNWAITILGPATDGRILVRLPPARDPERLKNLITAGGKLELVHVISPPSPAMVQTYDTMEEAITSLGNGGTVPPNRRVLPYSGRGDIDSAASKRWVVVESPSIVDGNDIKDASAAKSSYESDYDVMFSLNKVGARRFGDWTAANINEYLGVVLNDEVKSIAFIKSQITDQGQISGRFTKQAAEDLALLLKSGALPAPIRIIEEGSDK